MAGGISRNNEQFIDQQIEQGVFRDRDQVLDAAVELLRKRRDYLDRIKNGRQQLDQGEYDEYDDDTLQRRFEQLKRRATGPRGAGT